MAIRRVVPNIVSDDADLSSGFYEDFLGLERAMDMGWIATYVSPMNPTAQVSVVRRTEPEAPPVTLSVEVDDVDRVHAYAIARGLDIVYPLTDEAWGVRRFFVRDPNGVIVNVLTHLPRSGE